MARFTKNTITTSELNGSPLATSDRPDAVTGNGGKGFSYSDKSALFVLGVSNFTGQDTFYESGQDRDERYIELIRSVAAQDAEWVAKFLVWLRSSANIRTAAVTGAVEYGRFVSGKTVQTTGRALLAQVLQRADEPSEALGYWLSKYGKPLPKWFKRGLGDAAKKLYTEKSVLKYDSAGAAVRFGDVIAFSQVDTSDSPYKASVFAYAQDRRYDNVDLQRYPVRMRTVAARQLFADVAPQNRSDFLASHSELVGEAGHTWESLASWIGGELTAGFWESMIPDMGYMALLRNLRNFDKAGISDSYAKFVADKISDESGVANSRQLPLRFLSAYRVLEPTDHRLGYYQDLPAISAKYRKIWSPAVSKALDLSLKSVPELPGRTIIMIDVSGSMFSRISQKSTVTYYDNAVAFGVALGLRAKDAEVVGYDSSSKRFELSYDSSLLANIKQFQEKIPAGGGTNTIGVASDLMSKFGEGANRLIILTDEQADYYGHSLGNVVPKHVNIFTFNLVGYQVAHADHGRDNFFAVAGMNDSGFQMISSVEAAGSAQWPWES